MGWQGAQVRFFHDEGRVGTHAEDPLGFGIGEHIAPGARLGVQIGPVAEGASSQEISFGIGERALHPALAIGIANAMRDEPNTEQRAKARHLGRDQGVGSAATDDDHRGVVDGAARASALHEAQGLGQKGLGLEAGEGRVVLDKEPAAVSQHQAERP